MHPPNLRTADTDLLYRCLADDPPLRAVVVVATRLVRDAVGRHGLTGLPAVALGRGLCAGLLLATVTKGGERVTLQVAGGEGSVTVDANDLGQVRGYLTQRPPRKGSGAPPVGGSDAAAASPPLPPSPPARLSVASLLGSEGRVVVHRDLGLREIYQGSCELASGEVDEDLQRYLTDSEQMPSVLRAAVLLDEAGAVRWAGGILVQTTPGAGPETLAAIAERVAGGILERELPRAEELLPVLEDCLDQPAWILEWRRVEFHCPCDAYRVGTALRTLGLDDLRVLLAKEGRAEVTCQFCGRVHAVEADALEGIIQTLEAELFAAEIPAAAEAAAELVVGPPGGKPAPS